MIELILAMTKSCGIGYQNKLPWVCKKELSLFETKTMDNVVIVGQKTSINMPILQGRTVFIVNSSHSIEDAIRYNLGNKKIFIIGGATVYNYVLKNLMHIVERIHISIMNEEYTCDSFVNLNINDINFNTESKQEFKDFVHYVLTPKNKGEIQYRNLLSNLLENGKNTYGRNGNVMSDFVNHFTFNLTEGFPLLTTKKMFFRGIVEELLFFLRGDTDTKKLEQKGINIWKGNTSRKFMDSVGLNYPEGMMGPMYGYQWRFFNEDYTGININKGIDQLSNVIHMIKTDPKSRRILMTDFNPLQVSEGVLYPCHSIILQFFVEDNFLDMYCFNRSSDVFLGLPFNIASSSLMLMIIAKMTNLVPRYFNLSLGDCHIYEQHIECVKQQLERIPFKFPNVSIKDFNSIEDITYEHIILNNYNYHPSIKAEMVS
jgi:dihydrofolate reductase/thymidylate synthase